MQTLKVKLPDFVETDPSELSLILASELYEKGKLSIGQAAELAGYTKRTFMELLGNYGVSIFNYNAEDIEKDFQNA